MAASVKLGKAQTAVLNALKSGAELCRADIKEITGIKSGYTSLIGHDDPESREECSLLAKGYLKAFTYEMESGPNVTYYSITTSGKKALVASEKAAKAAK